MNRPPLREVAALAGVSEPTVSRVLNGKAGVASGTRSKVLAVVGELGYEPAAPSRSHTQTGNVGVICGDFLNPVFSTFTHHLAQTFGQRGRQTQVVVTDPDLTPEAQCVENLRRSRPDAMVFIGGAHAEEEGNLALYQRLIDDDVPVVLVNGRATSLNAPHVRCDEGRAARKAVTHLLHLGHRRIGCLVGPRRFVPTIRIISGRENAMAEFGVQADPGAVVECGFSFEEARAGARRLLATGVSAVVCGNDLMALGLVHAAESQGLSVPADLSVVGYDGTELSNLSAPPLTTMRQPFEEMAELVANAVVAETQGQHHFRDQYIFDADLVVRSSSGPAPLDLH